MPLDNANYISELNLNNPIGSIDTVNMTDDFFRELKKAIQQSFPNINKQTTITSDELNNLKTYMVMSGASWSLADKSLINVASIDNGTAVQPRNYNDGRYSIRANNLGDLPDPNQAVVNLMNPLPSGGSGYVSMRNHVINMVYPVGSMYINYSRDNNPRDFFGVGTWAPYSQGRVLLGAGSTRDSRGESRNFGRGSAGGEFQHVLSIAEMPHHSHGIPIASGEKGWSAAEQGNHDAGYGAQTTGAGGNGAHNNIQPYVTVAIWVRTA